MSLPSAREMFGEQLPRALAAHPARALEVGAVFRFTITGEGGGDWIVDLTVDPPTCEPSDGDNPAAIASAQCTIEVPVEDFRTMLSDGEAGMQLYFDGKLKVSGDPKLATRLPDLFAAIRNPIEEPAAQTTSR